MKYIRAAVRVCFSLSRREGPSNDSDVLSESHFLCSNGNRFRPLFFHPPVLQFDLFFTYRGPDTGQPVPDFHQLCNPFSSESLLNP